MKTVFKYEEIIWGDPSLYICPWEMYSVRGLSPLLITDVHSVGGRDMRTQEIRKEVATIQEKRQWVSVGGGEIIYRGQGGRDPGKRDLQGPELVSWGRGSEPVLGVSQ